MRGGQPLPLPRGAQPSSRDPRRPPARRARLRPQSPPLRSRPPPCPRPRCQRRPLPLRLRRPHCRRPSPLIRCHRRPRRHRPRPPRAWS
ncbi:MAG: hypothetical protein FJ011_09355 [Chloroflexi bacterium]|nr:hypothetical protein [Chloroflexota bacterium]